MRVMLETRAAKCGVTYLQKFLCGLYNDILNLDFFITDKWNNNRVKLFYFYGRNWRIRLSY